MKDTSTIQRLLFLILFGIQKKIQMSTVHESSNSLTWLSSLLALASVAFASSCSILLKEELYSSNWCLTPLENSIALLFTGLAGLLPSLVVLNEGEYGSKTYVEGFFTQFRRVSSLLLFMSSGGKIWVIFASLGSESAADLLNWGVLQKTNFRSFQFSKLFFTLLTKALTLTLYYSAVRNIILLFIMNSFLLRLFTWQYEEAVETRPFCLTVQCYGAIIAASIASLATTPGIAFQMYFAFEIASAGLFYDCLPSKIANFDDEKYNKTGIEFTMPKHNAVVVSGSTALVGTAYIAMNPMVICAFLYAESSFTLYHFGFIFAFVRISKVIGPLIANKLHQQTESLLKTGLITFWLSALSLTPAMMVYSTFNIIKPDQSNWLSFGTREILLAISCIAWPACFEALKIIENKIVLEWSNEETNDSLISIVIVTSALTYIGISPTLDDPTLIIVISTFSTVSSFLGAVCYTVWFGRNDRGPFRVVDEEGRELLRVTG